MCKPLLNLKIFIRWSILFPPLKHCTKVKSSNIWITTAHIFFNELNIHNSCFCMFGFWIIVVSYNVDHVVVRHSSVSTNQRLWDNQSMWLYKNQTFVGSKFIRGSTFSFHLPFFKRKVCFTKERLSVADQDFTFCTF